MRSSFKSKIVVLDEAGLASTEQIHGLLSLSKELKFRLMMLGDVKQLGVVETGKLFHYLQEHGFNAVSMNSIKRQQNKELLKSVVLAESAVDSGLKDSKKLISKSFEVLGEKNILDLSKHNQSKVYSNEDFACALYDKWKELNCARRHSICYCSISSYATLSER